MKREINPCSSTKMQACATAGGGVMYIPTTATQQKTPHNTVSYKDLINDQPAQKNNVSAAATHQKTA